MGHLIDSRTDGPILLADRPVPRAASLAGSFGRRPRPGDKLLPDAQVWNDLLGPPALSGGELEALAQIARPRTVAQGACVFTQHEAAGSLVFVCEGEAALGWCTPEGQFRVERPVRGPGWLDQSSAWIEARHAIDARAISPLVVVELPHDEVQGLLVSHPQLARRLITSLAHEVHALAVSTHGLMHMDAPARFAHWLLAHCRPLVDSPQRGVVKLGERKRDIASQLAITPETLSRLMRSLTRQGLITVAGYTVHVIDIDGLRQLAQAD